MRIGGWSFGSSTAILVLLPVIAIAGCAAWMLLPGSSDAGSQPVAVVSPPARSAQDAFWLDPAVTSTEATLVTPAQATAPTEAVAPEAAAAPTEVMPIEKPPIDGLKISSQRWRRGGLGSKALVTLTLRNANDYAVKDIEIACAFVRRDGSHLTDRKRMISDTINMKSRKTYAGMLVGFVNINANKAKCALVTASRI